jgi:hypothetical protein
MDLKLKETVKKITKKEIQKLFIKKDIYISDILIEFNKTLPHFQLLYGEKLKKIHIVHLKDNFVLCKNDIKINSNPANMFKTSSSLLCKNCLKIYNGLRGDKNG